MCMCLCMYVCVCVIYILLCMCVRHCARCCKLHVYYTAFARRVVLELRSQLLNLNMQRGCHRTPRAIRLIAEESYLSRERSIAPSTPSSLRRFHDYDACLRWTYISKIVSIMCATVSNDAGCTMDGCRTGPFSQASLRCFISVWYTCVLFFFPDCVFTRSRCFSLFLVSSLFFSLSKCIHTKKWIKAPNFLAYNRKWYAACRIGIGRRGNIYRALQTHISSSCTKSYEKKMKERRNLCMNRTRS